MTRKLVVVTFIAFTLLLLFALGACRKPVFEPSLNYIPPLVLSVSISDSLPAKAVQDLKLDHIKGIQIKHYSGLYSNYFEYEADKVLMLNTISALPFSIYAAAADSTCYQIPFETIEMMQQNLPEGEFENTAFFWNSNREDVEVYQCLKPPYRHIIQIPKNSNRILHRIEFTG
jgi:hypothetical protein